MRPCLAIDSDYLNIGIKPGMKKMPSHEILFIPTFAPSIKFIHTHFLSMGIMKDSTNKIFWFLLVTRAVEYFLVNNALKIEALISSFIRKLNFLHFFPFLVLC